MLPWVDLLEKKVQIVTNSFLQSDVTETRSGCALEATGIYIAGLD